MCSPAHQHQRRRRHTPSKKVPKARSSRARSPRNLTLGAGTMRIKHNYSAGTLTATMISQTCRTWSTDPPPPLVPPLSSPPLPPPSIFSTAVITAGAVQARRYHLQTQSLPYFAPPTGLVPRTPVMVTAGVMTPRFAADAVAGTARGWTQLSGMPASPMASGGGGGGGAVIVQTTGHSGGVPQFKVVRQGHWAEC